jgi:putative transposase
MRTASSASLAAQRETAWRERLARFAGGRQTVAAFCRREAVSVATFYHWRARLLTGAQRALSRPARAPVTSAFIDLGSVDAGLASSPVPAHAPTAPTTPINLRLDLGGGVVLHIVRH